MSNNDIKNIVNKSLDRAEAIWNEVGTLMFAECDKSFRAAIPSQIPEHSLVDPKKPEVGEFIALVVDMRKSSRHLMCEIAEAKVSRLQRIFYEVSALLPATAQSIYDRNGKITEYLGDGLLSIFKVDNNNPEKSLYASYNAACECIENVHNIVNPILNDRYSLPDISIGVGLAKSKAVVTTIGLVKYMQPKVFGECVFYASKLSSGNNQIYISESLKNDWPTSKGGVLTFTPKKLNNVDGYLVTSK
ncbi:MAG: adenylate/guanylate cyclase [Candidatus Electrothrix sp. GM3_4]|nr:adenylate/guanylate cyclase [Candidatus Electrothrix sp. GM3_4]